MPRPTITDVAQRAGVSTGAVSLAFNGRRGLSEQTRARIIAVADELGWQPSHRARSLVSSRAFSVGLVLARPAEVLGADPFFPSFMAGVQKVLLPAGYALLLQVVPDHEAEEAAYRRLAGEGRVDGVFVCDLRVNDPRIALLAALGLPAITLNRPDIDSPFPAVTMDDQDGVRVAVEHLVEQGHTRIAHVSGAMEFLHSRSRRSAWEQAVTTAGLLPDLLIESDFTASGGATATAQLLDATDPPTAIVYANDVMAIAGLAVAQRRGLRLPDELSLVGFDGTELASHVYPALTTIASDPFGWSQVAATKLLAVIDRKSPRDLADVELEPSRLQLRASTGPPLRRPTSQ